jgi:hypothetical protein
MKKLFLFVIVLGFSSLSYGDSYRDSHESQVLGCAASEIRLSVDKMLDASLSAKFFAELEVRREYDIWKKISFYDLSDLFNATQRFSDGLNRTSPLPSDLLKIVRWSLSRAQASSKHAGFTSNVYLNIERFQVELNSVSVCF